MFNITLALIFSSARTNGVRQHKDARQQSTEYSYIVAVIARTVQNGENYDLTCSGTAINAYWVLTAVDCVRYKYDSIFIEYDDVRQYQISTMNVYKTVISPEYHKKKDISFLCNDNLALLNVGDIYPMKFAKPSGFDYENLSIGQRLTYVGYGLQEDQKGTEKVALRRPLITSEGTIATCPTVHEDHFDRYICLYQNGLPPKSGPGSPLLYGDEVIGFLTVGPENKPADVVYFAPVRDHLQWIKERTFWMHEKGVERMMTYDW